ncbi:nicotinamide riboside transporter PnuC [Shewanella maritima]|uniref:nicotinamide riboside transporter PnuC n=1 Tax=Shewanella maritima TaxID=2520507 RepID=UPI003735FDC7
MIEAFSQAIADAGAMTAWESVAVVLAIAYLALAMKANKLCWFAAFFSTLIYTVLFWNVSLLMESALNVYYMGMAVYGYWLWVYRPNNALPSEQAANTGSASQTGSDIVSWSLQRHLTIIAVTSVISLILGYVMATYTQASFAYLDAATTCFAVMTTYLVAKKVLENWLYWVVIDLVSIYLYFHKGLMLTSLLFVGYVFMAVAGYFMWKKRLEPSQHNAAIASL